MSEVTDEARDEPRRINPADVQEGDRVAMAISLHGTTLSQPGVERKSFKSVAIGTVVRRPRESFNESLRNGERIMADFTVETPDGTRYTWEVDNGYVIGPHQSLGRRSDVGRFGSFYDPDSL